MSVTQTTRLGIYRWSSGADSFTRSQLDTSHEQIEALAAGFLQDTTRPLPATKYKGFFHYNTATQAISYCDGSQWIGMNSFGSPAQQTFDAVGSDGISTDVARADHEHPMPGFGVPVDVGSTNQTGVADTVARSDHQHKLADFIISGGAIQTNTVDTPHLVDGAVTQIKLASNSVGSAQIVTGAVGSAELADNSVADNHLQANSVGTSELKDGSVGTDQVSSIDASKITGTVSTSPDIDASKVVSGVLAVARIPNLNASKITAGTLGVDRIPSLSASKITSGTLDSARIPNLNASKITAGDLANARGPERIKTTFSGTERYSRIYVSDSGPSGGEAYDIWIEY